MPGFDTNVINPEIMQIKVNVTDINFNIIFFKYIICKTLNKMKHIEVGIKQNKKFLAFKLLYK